jgi:hypothetical protein
MIMEKGLRFGYWRRAPVLWLSYSLAMLGQRWGSGRSDPASGPVRERIEAEALAEVTNLLPPAGRSH